jgi:hypothetical protein
MFPKTGHILNLEEQHRSTKRSNTTFDWHFSFSGDISRRTCSPKSCEVLKSIG